MSSPSGAADATLSTPSARGNDSNRDAALATADDDDKGQPVIDLPPLIEPKLDPFASRPPRRSFLAPPSRDPPVVPPRQVAPASEGSPLVEPMPDKATRPPVGSGEAEQRRPAILALVSWLARHRPVVIAAAICVAIAAAVAVAAYVLRTGPFAGAHRYPIAAAPADPAQRVAYFQHGADAGDVDDEMQLAIVYAKGEGVPQDYEKAAKWFRAAADQGMPRAQYDLGVMYERGRGVTADPTEAANWYLKSAQGGYPLAQYNLAVCYTKGQGIRQDLAEAALWYRRAATQGVVQAMVNLAVMYDKGNGVGASAVDAYAWYRAAGQRGNQSAQQRAEYLYGTMEKLDQIHAEALTSDVAKSIHDFSADGDAVSAAPVTEH